MTRTTLSLRVAMLLALAIPTVSASAQKHKRGGDDSDESRGVDTTLAFDRRGVVNVSIPSGEIIVTGWDRDQVRVHATSEDAGVRVSATSYRLTIELASARRSGDARIEVTVPLGVRVSARSQTGDISVRGTKGAVEAVTQSGDIAVEDVADRVEVSSLSGDVGVSGVAGDVEAKSTSGDVSVTGVKGGGDIEVETVSGEITVRDAVAKVFRGHSVSGDVTYDGSIDPQGRYELTAHSGEIRLGVPKDLAAQISVSTWNGSITSDFPITMQPGEHGIGSANAKRFNFVVGNGGARITLESFSGDITINNSGRTRNE
jgi:DUF4097 and DUF4098 domain-containing protein YvlB